MKFVSIHLRRVKSHQCGKVAGYGGCGDLKDEILILILNWKVINKVSFQLCLSSLLNKSYQPFVHFFNSWLSTHLGIGFMISEYIFTLAWPQNAHPYCSFTNSQTLLGPMPSPLEYLAQVLAIRARSWLYWSSFSPIHLAISNLDFVNQTCLWYDVTQITISRVTTMSSDA